MSCVRGRGVAGGGAFCRGADIRWAESLRGRDNTSTARWRDDDSGVPVSLPFPLGTSLRPVAVLTSRECFTRSFKGSEGHWEPLSWQRYIANLGSQGNMGWLCSPLSVSGCLCFSLDTINHAINSLFHQEYGRDYKISPCHFRYWFFRDQTQIRIL